MATEVVEKRNPKAVRLDVSTRTHQLLRRMAAEADMSMATYARVVLMGHLETEARRRGIEL